MKPTPPSPVYEPDYRLGEAYEEATNLDDTALEAICPSYLEIVRQGPRYTDESLLGRGATKEVVRAFDTVTKRWVALARVHPDAPAEAYDQFIHEAWLTSPLTHPNIISIHDLGVGDDGRPFFTMDLKGDNTLASLLKSPTRPDLPDLLRILGKICDAVAYAHGHQVLHLDLKPENIQADPFGNVLVCDWGLGRISNPRTPVQLDFAGPDGLTPGERHDNDSLTGQIRGTPGYMAPEQADPAGIKDKRTDVFALGCLLHAILTGVSPLAGVPRDQQLELTLRADFTSSHLKLDKTAIPSALESIFDKATEQDPIRRYPSVTAFAEDLTAYLNGYSTKAENAGFFKEAALFLRRNRLATAVSFLALVGLTTLSILFIQRINNQRGLTEEAEENAALATEQRDKLRILHTLQTTENEEQIRDLALSFADSAQKIKDLGIFTNPGQAVDEARRITSLALTLDPDCEPARFQQIALNCIALNFRAALDTPPIDHNHPYADYQQIAKVAPDFAFDHQTRPTPTTLADFLRRLAKINPDRAPLMERLISYDLQTRNDFEGYHQVLSAILAYRNPRWSEDDGFNYDPSIQSLELQSKEGLLLLIPAGGGSGRCLLRLIPIRELRLKIAGPLELSNLNYLALEPLDLRHCPNTTVKQAVFLPTLKEIHIKKGQLSKKLLKVAFRSLTPFQVIEHP